MSHIASFRRLTLLCLAVGAFACGRGEEADGAEDGDESAAVTSSESALTTTLSDEVMQPMSATAEQLATNSTSRVKGLFKPAGCATSTQAGVTVTYVLNDCTGPYGLVHVTGTLQAVYSRASNGGVGVVVTGTGVKVNEATLDVNSTVTVTQSSGVKTAVVSSNTSGMGPRGGALTRKGDFTVVYDAANECLTLNGTWDTSVGARTATTTVANYNRCKGTCPKAGGSIVHSSSASKLTVTLTYDGSAVAKWATERRDGTVNLRCTP